MLHDTPEIPVVDRTVFQSGRFAFTPHRATQETQPGNHLQTHFDSMVKAYRDHWQEWHTVRNPDPAWLASWLDRIPNECGRCGPGFQSWVDANPPRFEDWFPYSVEGHNFVNAKLGKPLVPLTNAKTLYPQCVFGKQPSIADLVAVTSLAPHRLDRQAVCLDSWKQLGLSIVSVNSQAEIENIGSEYSQVDQWIVASDPDCKTQRINTLLDVATSLQTPILLINADIEIYGDQSRLVDLVSQRKSAVGVRHNYDDHPGDAKVEPWGIDAFLVYPDQVAKLSKVNFSIGKPMWDYWLPWELEKISKLEWITAPYFFHKSHELAWNAVECESAHKDFADQFEAIDWNAWRSSRPK
jgi:hypothetical protein